MEKAPVDLRELTAAGLAAFCAGLGLPHARAGQVFAWLYRPGTRDFAAAGTLNRDLRALLARHARISALEPESSQRSADGTVKYAFRLADGALVESVLIPSAGRHTLCLSSQAGCAMGCRFCRTASMGFRRNLTAAEIVNQVLAVRERMIADGVVRATPRQLIDNLVFMGMGEPLANYEHLLTALDILMDERGLGFTERRVTVSTCGLVPRIRELGRDARVNLAVSLHAADDAVRSGLMPVNRTWGVNELLAACRAYPLGGRRVVFIECVLISGVNDAEQDALKLAEQLQGLACRVNLLPYNESPGLAFRRAPERSLAMFKEVLRRAGIRALVRNSRGVDISAACGQLAGAGGESSCSRPAVVLLNPGNAGGRP